MARIKKGIFDPPQGSLGNLVFSSRNGVPYVRTKPETYRDAKTPAQQAARARLSLVSSLLRQLKPMLRSGFPETPPGKSSRDLAHRLNAARALRGTWPDLAIDYPNVLVSHGSLAPGSLRSSKLLPDGSLEISWAPSDTAVRMQHGSDRVMVTLLNPEQNQLCFYAGAGMRQDQATTIRVPETLSGDFHAWLSFASSCGRFASESCYAGRFSVCQ
ncbi:MAG: hypothetical protein JJU35_15260 [Balneolales bacterium]|nr:hypothetical protein [Balneolales bacterium]